MFQYCEEIFQTNRRKTREVKVGSVGVGGNNPIRIQSMTTSSTRDVEATLLQIMKLADAGCEIVRMTVQGIKEAESCEAIASGLLQKGYVVPLVADIHFYPPAAMRAVEFVDKIRINPGNFADKRALFLAKEYTDDSYREELLKIEETFTPLVEKCKRLKKSMRIGTNHGSLSDRIMNRYGDTPYGMVESALEFARICRKQEYHDFIFSMKASNPLVMIQAYRLLCAEMFKLGWDYPLHLGVTEAGEGEDGRIKSALGIGALLLDGIGDTIRVSLTEDPWAEMDPCRKMAFWALNQEGKGTSPFQETHRNIQAIQKSPSQVRVDSGLHPTGSVMLKVTKEDLLDPQFVSGVGLKKKEGVWVKSEDTPDLIWAPEESDLFPIFKEAGVRFFKTNEIVPIESALQDSKVLWIRSLSEEVLAKALLYKPEFFMFSSENSLVHEGRRLFEWFCEHGVKIPIILFFAQELMLEDTVIHSSIECGSLLIDGLFDGICLESKASYLEKKTLSFSLMQAVRRRTTKTEFISCPGCGRTLFDLQSVSKRIREKTSHLPGVRIAIMGCIVNGPGEMADADFGYVGSKAGKIDLYVGKKCVEKNIDFQEADERLIALIQKHGMWVDPAPLEESLL